jgi:hypothetical protein
MGKYMFGYVVTNSDELKVKEWKEYKAFYCGLCHSLRNRHGIKGQITLNYDCVFIAILLTGLYEPKTEEEKKFCPLHPMGKRTILSNEMIDYVSDLDIMLAYHNLKDGWQDEKNVLKWMSYQTLKADYKRMHKKYPRQAQALETYMNALNIVQDREEQNLDTAANLTGVMMGELFVWKEDEWASYLRKIGFYLGKYIYLMDAFDDLEEDLKKNQYNVWKYYKEQEDFEEQCEHILTYMMAECAKEFEKLPIFLDVEILRNILYSGIWNRFDHIKKHEKQEHVMERI